MARLGFELVVLLLIVAGLLYAARQRDSRRSGLFRRRRADQLPAANLAATPEASWEATHYGTARETTEVAVLLRGPGRADIWDRRTCAVIDNRDPDYDKLLYNAMEEARLRAGLLNSMRSG